MLRAGGEQMTAVKQLGYLVFEVSDLAAWEDFGTKILGLQVVDRAETPVFPCEWMAISSASSSSAGPRTTSRRSAGRSKGRLSSKRSHASQGSRARSRQGTADKRPAKRARHSFASTTRPGIPIEIFYGPKMADEPFVSEVVRSGFVADEQGFGHVVVVSKDDESTKSSTRRCSA